MVWLLRSNHTITPWKIDQNDSKIKIKANGFYVWTTRVAINYFDQALQKPKINSNFFLFVSFQVSTKQPLVMYATEMSETLSLFPSPIPFHK